MIYTYLFICIDFSIYTVFVCESVCVCLINCDSYPILKCTITKNKSVYALYGLRLLIMTARLMKRSARAILERLFVRPIIITKLLHCSFWSRKCDYISLPVISDQYIFY